MTEAEISKAAEEIWQLFRETDRRFKESIKETDQQFKETALQFKETGKETDRRFKETDRQFKETDRKIKELGRQIGGLGDKFGSFTEGMAFPSIRRILMDRFGAKCVSPRVLVRRNGDSFEADVLGYSEEKVYLVEVKSILKNDHIEEILDNLRRFSLFFPEHKDKALYGIIAAVDIAEHLKRKVLKEGLYMAIIREDTFCLEVPEEFEPKQFNEVSSFMMKETGND